MRGYLCVNHFLKNDKFDEIYDWLVKAARDKNVELIVKTNVQLMPCVGEEYKKTFGIDFILFWDKDIMLAQFLETQNISVFNSSNAIKICDNKALTHIVLNKENIPMPKTFVMPKTFSNVGYTNLSFLDEVERVLSYPVIVKEWTGSFGQQVYLCHNKNEVLDKLSGNVLIQEFMESSVGKDIRLQVVGNQVVTSMFRFSCNGDFRANVSNGGKMQPYYPDDRQKKLALQCVKAIGLDFAGVDILFGRNGEPVVCEVNSNAHFKNIYDCTGVNTAEYIMDDIIRKVERKKR